MHERGRLERVPRRLMLHAVGREPAQFLVNEGKQLLRRSGVALLNRGEDACNVVQGVTVRDTHRT